MEKFIKKGYAYIKENIIEISKPIINSDPVGILEKGEVINYEDIVENESRIWISYNKDDIKRYILAIDNNNYYFANLSTIKDGNYIIKLSQQKEEVKIEFFEQKFLIQFVPEENSYRIICIDSNNSLGVNDEMIIEETEIFSEKEIKWEIKKIDFNEFSFADSKTGLQMEYSEDSKKIILSEIDINSKNQKFLLISEENKDKDKDKDKDNDIENINNEEKKENVNNIIDLDMDDYNDNINDNNINIDNHKYENNLNDENDDNNENEIKDEYKEEEN
jgi:hypothetical protein